MDIGDPNEIPATRKKLPSMQELGAFDFGAPAGRTEAAPAGSPATIDARGPSTGAALPAAPAVPRRSAPARSAVAPPAPTRPAELDTGPAALQGAPAASAGAPPRSKPTTEQLREALAKADPQTRQKLMRLIAGGRTVQQVGPASQGGARRRNLVMQLEADTPRARAAASPPPVAPPRPAPAPPPASGFGAFTATPRTTAAPAQGFARPSAGPRPAARPAEPALMQIDEHTELLDAVAPGVSPDARKADLQAQLAQAQRQAAAPEPARSEPLAHKVLFPAYDPNRHGDDVHGATRRRHEGPIEGHFPAPRQPFKPTYRHPDGRPMTAEETQVEEVLQTQRCEETLSVLARDGVNGLLLSPRDLDAAVANGVLSAEAAATLWKTWSALRPVIHVIEDEPPPADAAGAGVVGEAADAAPGGTAVDEAPSEKVDTVADGIAEPMPPAAPTRTAPADQAGAPARPAEAAGPAVGPQTDAPHHTSVEATVTAGAASTAPPAPAPATAPAGPPAARSPAKAASVSAPTTAIGPPPPSPREPQPEPPTLPLPRATPTSQPVPALAATAATVPDVGASADALAPMAPGAMAMPAPTPADVRRTRLKTLARGLFWVFVAYCVLATSARLALLAWARWGHLLVA